MERREMCGVFFTTVDRDDEDGFDIQVDNPSSQAVAVNVNLADSANVRINPKTCSHHVHVISDLVAEVMVPAQTKAGQISIPVDVIDDEEEMALALEVIPGPKVDTIVEPCGIVSYVRSLPSLKGFEFSFDNPTTKNFESVSVSFTADGCKVTSGPGASAAGSVVTFKSIPAGKKGVLLAKLPSMSPGSPISCKYKLDAKEAAKAEPEVVDKKVLENKSVVEVVALPDDAGFEFHVSNPTDTSLDFKVDFKGSENLKIDPMPPAAELTSSTTVSAPKVAGATKKLVVARLTPVDPEADVALGYTVESTAWVKAKDKKPKDKKTKKEKKVKVKGGDGGSGGGSSAASSSQKSKTGLFGRPGRSETQTLKCGMIITSTLLENLAGYTVTVANPTDGGFKMMVEFVKAENVEVVAEGTAVSKGPTTVQVEVPAGSDGLIVAALPSKEKGKSIAMEYTSKVAALK